MKILTVFLVIYSLSATAFICDDSNGQQCTNQKNKQEAYICGDKNHPCNEQNQNNESENE